MVVAVQTQIPTCHRDNLGNTLDKLQYLSYNCGGDSNQPKFKDCCEAKFLRYSEIVPVDAIDLEHVYCDQDTDGGGWMVILRRTKGNLNFFRKLKFYVKGFGNLNRDFWLGLRHIHFFTLYAAGSAELRIELTKQGEKFFVHYDDFYVGNGNTLYTLRVGGYRNESTLPDSLSFSSGSKFVAWDTDNKPTSSGNNCTAIYRDAWWHNESCTKVSLLKDYSTTEVPSGIIWERNGIKESFDTVEMKIRPKRWDCGGSFDNYIIDRSARAEEYPFLNPFWIFNCSSDYSD